ncbi:MAG: glycoside hydrolase family 2 protein [Bryobacteraceae bacterium]|jgi:beta-mannosidase
MMKQPRRFALVLSLLVSAVSAAESIALNSGWEFRQRADVTGAKDSDWHPAQVPGVVHTDLLRNKLVPDPFYRDNEAKLQWIENADWEYRSTITATPALLRHRNIELVFEGLDTYSEIWLNDTQVLTADNMFREWRVDVKPYLKAGANALRVVFPSPIRAAAKVAATDKWRERTHTAEKAYIRKAAYEFGWDWGPRFVTSGIWRPVRLEVWDRARISDVHIRQRDVTATVAHVVAEVEVTAAADEAAEVAVEFAHGRSSGAAMRTVELHAGVNHIDLPVDIGRPDLWYPAGYGAQPIYKFSARVRVAERVEDEAIAHTGVRSIVLRRDLDKWGRSFELVVNGIPVFGKGADVIPFDSFPTRVTTAQYRRVLQSAKDANMNMIRHWGGGYYETQEFYDICDELGIMIWQDFMFGNDWQPGTYAFKQSVAQEAEDQVRRLRNHPSIVLWCGNNETEAAYIWVMKDQTPDSRRRMWEDYLTVFSGILARAVERLTPETPYWPSSPSADYEEISATYQSGDMHDWSVWHGRVPFSEYEKHFPRFMTEYGFQSFPEMRTVEEFTTPEDRASIFTPVMLAHQKNNAGNAIIHDYLLRYYAEPKDFASFLYVSQVLQAEGIKVGAEHLRRTRPRAMGSIYWQLNDCWPVASWSSLDYYGRWKALQYYARWFYNDLLVSPHVEDGNLAVYVVSDRTAPTSGELRVRLMTFDGTVVSDKSQAVQVPALSSQIYLQVPKEALGGDLKQIFAVADLKVGGKTVSSNLLLFALPKEVHLPAAEIASELTKAGDSYRLRLSSKVLARSVNVSFGGVDAKVSDDYFDLLPGQPVDIRVDSAATADQLRANLKVVSLTDAFAAGK